MNYFEKTDPIGMNNNDSLLKDYTNKMISEDLEHDLICGLDSDIKTMRNDLNELKDVIDGYETYTPNRLMLNQLKMLHNKLVNGINAIDSGYNAYKDLHE